MMSNLSTPVLLIFAFAPLVITIMTLAGISRATNRKHGTQTDGPEQLLSAAVRWMPVDRADWGRAMLAELRGIWSTPTRWWFALGCARVALFPPAPAAARGWLHTIKRLGPICGISAVALPPLGLPLLYLAAVAANRFTTSDDFFNNGWIPASIGVLFVTSVAMILAGIPLGIAGLLRREQVRWLSVMGFFSSLGIFAYLQIVQAIAANLASIPPC